MNYVYWIHDESCFDVKQHGYVGVTNDPKRRLATHLRKNRVPAGSSITVLLEGTREECFEYEKLLRPHRSIGWNSAVGGAHGWKVGFHHSDDARSKMKNAWSEDRKKRASILKAEHNISLTGQKRPNQSAAMRGENNPMYGKSQSDSVRHAVSKAHKGKTPMNKQEIYCVGCRQRASLSVLNKYHGKCLK